MTRVKICGLMSKSDMDMAVSAGADSLGFVTEYFLPVPWNLSRKRSSELIAVAPTTRPMDMSAIAGVAIFVADVRDSIKLYVDSLQLRR